MDKDTQQQLDAIVEDDLHRGFRIVEVPESFKDTPSRYVRISRLNPGKRRKIAEIVQRQYHKDLKNPDILSNEQILQLVKERGEWTEAMEIELRSLQKETAETLSQMFFDGVADDQWVKDYVELTEEVKKMVASKVPADQQARAIEIFDRWAGYTKASHTRYDEQFAADQGKEAYSLDWDQQRLLDLMPAEETVVLLEKVEDLRAKLERYTKYQEQRRRMHELQTRYARIFADSVEQRRDSAEEMAKLFLLCEFVNDIGIPVKPIAESYEALWDNEDEFISWLSTETYFFLQGMPAEVRQYYEALGFRSAGREKTESSSAAGELKPSDESPAPLNSNSDSKPLEVTVSDSMDSKVPLTSTTAS